MLTADKIARGDNLRIVRVEDRRRAQAALRFFQMLEAKPMSWEEYARAVCAKGDLDVMGD